MAEALKNKFGKQIPETIGKMIEPVYPEFVTSGFVAHVIQEYDEFGLMARGQKIAQSLRQFLPKPYPTALDVLVKSIKNRPATYGEDTLGSFLFLPYSYFIADYGIDCFDESMEAIKELTKVFTSEFCIRPFIERYPDQTLSILKSWTQDKNEHVRRLVSEGTRSRLPWGTRLKIFQKNPNPAIELLEFLKDDESLYVRRSVANHLNDIGKDNPDILLAVVDKWIKDASKDRLWIISHALRSQVKFGNKRALHILGYGKTVEFKINNVVFSPEKLVVGGKVRVDFELKNCSGAENQFLIDLKVYFVKKNGNSKAKVFKISKVTIKDKVTNKFSKIVSLENLTTRSHFPGLHKVTVLVNGIEEVLGEFNIVE